MLLYYNVINAFINSEFAYQLLKIQKFILSMAKKFSQQKGHFFISSYRVSLNSIQGNYFFNIFRWGNYLEASKSYVSTDFGHILEKRGGTIQEREGGIFQGRIQIKEIRYSWYIWSFFARIQPPEHHLFLKNGP